jgi:2'-5' RNA ligase
MKYYLVALFDNDTYSNLEVIQKDMCHKYKIYKNQPMIHIPLEVIDDPNMEVIDNIINGIIKPYKKFKVYSSGALSFDAPYKSVNLKIENKGYIIRLAKKINEKLKENGFKVRENIENLDLHASLANTSYIIKELSNKESGAASIENKKGGFQGIAKIDRIELWKGSNNRKDMIIKSYPLREY